MEFCSCDFIEHKLVLDQLNKIRHCSNTNMQYGGHPIIFDNYYGDISMLKHLFEKKWEHRILCRKGIIPDTCLNCFHLEYKNWDNDDYINHIVLTPWSNCNAKCIYCPIQTDSYVKANTKEYDYYTTIKYMIDNNFFSNDAVLDFAGGEPSLWNRFADILKLIHKRRYETIIHTNSIIYVPEISQLIQTGNCKVVTSIDSGNPQLFKKIKQVDAFDKVCYTLKNYSQAQTVKKNAVRTKYIIIPGVNDNENDILQFLNLSADLGIISVILNLDFNFLVNNYELIEKEKDLPYNSKNTTLRVYDLIDFTIEEGKKLGLKVSLYGEIFKLKTIVEGKITLNIVDD